MEIKAIIKNLLKSLFKSIDFNLTFEHFFCSITPKLPQKLRPDKIKFCCFPQKLRKCISSE